MTFRYTGAMGKRFEGNLPRAHEVQGTARLLVQQCIDQINYNGGWGQACRQLALRDGTIVKAIVLKMLRGIEPIVRVEVFAPGALATPPPLLPTLTGLYIQGYDESRDWDRDMVLTYHLQRNEALNWDIQTVTDDKTPINHLGLVAAYLRATYGLNISTPQKIPPSWFDSFDYTIPHRDPLSKLASATLILEDSPATIVLGGIPLITEIDIYDKLIPAVYGDSIFVARLHRSPFGGTHVTVYHASLHQCPMRWSDLTDLPTAKVMLPELPAANVVLWFLQWHPQRPRFVVCADANLYGPATSFIQTTTTMTNGASSSTYASSPSYYEINSGVFEYNVSLSPFTLTLDRIFTSIEYQSRKLKRRTYTQTYHTISSANGATHTSKCVVTRAPDDERLTYDEQSYVHIAFGRYDKNGDLSVFGCQTTLACAVKTYGHSSAEGAIKSILGADTSHTNAAGQSHFTPDEYEITETREYTTVFGPLKSQNTFTSTSIVIDAIASRLYNIGSEIDLIADKAAFGVTAHTKYTDATIFDHQQEEVTHMNDFFTPLGAFFVGVDWPPFFSLADYCYSPSDVHLHEHSCTLTKLWPVEIETSRNVRLRAKDADLATRSTHTTTDLPYDPSSFAPGRVDIEYQWSAKLGVHQTTEDITVTRSYTRNEIIPYRVATRRFNEHRACGFLDVDYADAVMPDPTLGVVYAAMTDDTNNVRHFLVEDISGEINELPSQRNVGLAFLL